MDAFTAPDSVRSVDVRLKPALRPIRSASGSKARPTCTPSGHILWPECNERPRDVDLSRRPGPGDWIEHSL